MSDRYDSYDAALERDLIGGLGIPSEPAREAAIRVAIVHTDNPIELDDAEDALDALLSENYRYRKALVHLQKAGLSEAWVAEIIRVALEGNE